MAATVPRYYLSRERDCLQFPWGGCGGNLNNFPSRLSCLSTCQPGPAVTRPGPGCALELELGRHRPQSWHSTRQLPAPWSISLVEGKSNLIANTKIHARRQ